MSKPSFLQQFGQQIATRDGCWRCHYCTIPLIPPGMHLEPGPYEMIGGYRASIGFERACVDHVNPQDQRWWLPATHHLDNMVLACRLCNQRKKNKPYDRFVAEITRWRDAYNYPRGG